MITLRAKVALSCAAVSIALAAAAEPAVKPAAEDPAKAALRAGGEAYDQTRCADVLAILEALPAGTSLDGVSTYRRGYCLGATRRGDPMPEYRKAAELLASETAAPGAPLEAHFYRVNALLNTQQRDEARKAAQLACERHRGGTLIVPQADADGWFRLGKLYRDAGDDKGALAPFRRALEASQGGSTLNVAYLERIADGARAAGDIELAKLAAAKLEERRPTDPQNALRRGRTLLASGDIPGARLAFNAARPAGGEVGMAAQYSAMALDRLEELVPFKLAPAETLADGTPIASADLAAAISDVSRRAWTLMQQGKYIEKPRKKGTGTRLFPAPETETELRLLQAEFAGVLRESIVRGAPIREWAIQGGFAPLIHHPWARLFREQAEKREAAAKAPAAAPAAPPAGGAPAPQPGASPAR